MVYVEVGTHRNRLQWEGRHVPGFANLVVGQDGIFSRSRTC